MSTSFAVAARALLVHEAAKDCSSEPIAAAAAQAMEKLSKHLSRIVGKVGVCNILSRSVTLASATFPWLASAGPAVADRSWTGFRSVMETQDPDMATEAFVVLFTTFVGLLGRLIGNALVVRLLSEVWPDTFAQATPHRGGHD